MPKVINLTNEAIQQIADTTLDTHFAKTWTTIDLNKYTEHLVKNAVNECIKVLRGIAENENAGLVADFEIALYKKFWMIQQVRVTNDHQ